MAKWVEKVLRNSNIIKYLIIWWLNQNIGVFYFMSGDKYEGDFYKNMKVALSS